jgi:hypothetical protein
MRAAWVGLSNRAGGAVQRLRYRDIQRPAQGTETHAAEAVALVCTHPRRFPIRIAANNTPCAGTLLELEQRSFEESL